MNCLIALFIGLLVGTSFGVLVMCLMSINRKEEP